MFIWFSSDESGGEDTDNRLRNISRFSESDRSLGRVSHRQSAGRYSYQFSDDSSIERPVLFHAGSGNHPGQLLAGMERNDLSGSSSSTPNNRRHRRKKKSLNEGLKMSNLSVCSVVSTISSKYPIDPTNNTPSDSDSVSSRKTSSYACNKLAESSDNDVNVRINKNCSSSIGAANLINLVEEEPIYIHPGFENERGDLRLKGKCDNSASSESGGTRISLEGRPNVKCKYNKLKQSSPSSKMPTSSKDDTCQDVRGKRRRKKRKTKRHVFSSCMKGSVDVTNSSASEDKLESPSFESQTLLSQPTQVSRLKKSAFSELEPKEGSSSKQAASYNRVSSLDSKLSPSGDSRGRDHSGDSACLEESVSKRVATVPSEGPSGDSSMKEQSIETSAAPSSKCCGIQWSKADRLSFKIVSNYVNDDSFHFISFSLTGFDPLSHIFAVSPSVVRTNSCKFLFVFDPEFIQFLLKCY